MENLSKILPSIGAMDEEITIQSFTESRNASGEQILTFSTYATVLARVKWPDAGMKETYSADQQTAFRKIVFEIRYDSTLDMRQKWRVLYRQVEIADIIGIGTLGRDRFNVLNCQLREETIDYLTDEDGNPLTDDSGNILTP
jgi:SPP1 family predicted phage head-tail adaptor